MYTKLKEFNFDPVIIALTRHENIYFIKNHVKLKEINQSYQELKEEDYDFLVVNSDQTWANVTPPNYLLDYGYLRFAEKWKVPKFVYGASFPFYSWTFSKQFNIQASNLLKNFSGISVREKQTVYLAMENLGVKPEFVLDPTLLIDKKYYLDLIKDYNQTFNFELNFLCVYQLDNNIQIEQFIRLAALNLKLEIHTVNINKNYYIEDFLKCINNSQAVITDSFHGTIFSIIFEKPFISFINSRRGNTRFISLKEVFKINDRIIMPNLNIYNLRDKIELLKKKFQIDKKAFDTMKNRSIFFLKKNLLIK